MGLWTMIFLIVISGMAFAAWKHHQDLKVGVVRDDDGNPVGNLGADKQREAELQSEVEQLRERIQVLERIATDGRESERLLSEIDKLRDQD